MHRHLSAENVLKSVNDGLRRARDEFNRRPEVQSGAEPSFAYGIIVCALRSFRPDFSEYYSDLWRVHRHSDANAIFAMASLELAQASVDIRDRLGIPIFAYAHKHFMKKTVHAGEAYGPESIFQAITDLHADRIGHGYYLYNTDMIQAEEITDREGYVRALVQFIADRRITLEICLTSNLQTIPSLGDLRNHTLRRMLDERQSVTLCTDNRTVSNTTITDEIMKAAEHLGLSTRDLRNSVIYGFKRSFFPDTYSRKRAYVRDIIDHYKRVEAEFGVVVVDDPS
jgi:adenosine deaminase